MLKTNVFLNKKSVKLFQTFNFYSTSVKRKVGVNFEKIYILLIFQLIYLK